MARLMRGFSELHYVMRTKDEVKTKSLFFFLVSFSFLTERIHFYFGCPLPGCLSVVHQSIHVGFLATTHGKLASYVTHSNTA